jgi:hypothetical protein
MDTTVGKLRIILTANAGRFQKTMKKARRTVAVFSKSAARFSLKIAGIGAALGGLVAGGSFALLIRNAFQAGDALAKTSDKLGIATEKLAAMRLAAELSGVDIRKMQLGLQRMTRRVSEAAIGTGEAKDAIKELGLDAKRLNALSPDKKMLEFAKAFKAVGTQSDRVRLAFKLFDSEGVDLVNTLILMSDKWEEIEDTTKRFGSALTRIDAAKLENVNDSLRMAQEFMKGAATQIAVNLAPDLALLSQAMLDVANDSTTMAMRIGKIYSKLSSWTVALAGGIESVFKTAWLQIRLSFEEMAAKLALKVGELLKKFDTFLFPTDALKKSGIIEFVESQIIIIDLLEKRIGKTVDDVANKYEKLINKIGDFRLEFEKLIRDKVGRGAGAGGGGILGGGANTLLGRTRAQGFLRAGEILGVQKVGTAQSSLKTIATNTKASALATKRLLLFFMNTSQGVELGT